MLSTRPSDEQAALDSNISVSTVSRLRRGKFCSAVKKAEVAREKIYRKKVWDGDNGWQGTAWFLERKYRTQFSWPEVQLNFQNNTQVKVANGFVIFVERSQQLEQRTLVLEAKAQKLLDRDVTASKNSD